MTTKIDGKSFFFSPPSLASVDLLAHTVREGKMQSNHLLRLKTNIHNTLRGKSAARR